MTATVIVAAFGPADRCDQIIRTADAEHERILAIPCNGTGWVDLIDAEPIAPANIRNCLSGGWPAGTIVCEAWATDDQVAVRTWDIEVKTTTWWLADIIEEHEEAA